MGLNLCGWMFSGFVCKVCYHKQDFIIKVNKFSNYGGTICFEVFGSRWHAFIAWLFKLVLRNLSKNISTLSVSDHWLFYRGILSLITQSFGVYSSCADNCSFNWTFSYVISTIFSLCCSILAVRDSIRYLFLLISSISNDKKFLMALSLMLESKSSTFFNVRQCNKRNNSLSLAISVSIFIQFSCDCFAAVHFVVLVNPGDT